jgi:RNA polymerase sigma-70 factor (ECF subfamily)
MSDASDAELIAIILRPPGPGAPRSGEAEDAYRRLLEKHWQTVIVLLRSRLHSDRDAEDVAQEAFVRAFRSLPKLKEPARFLGWLLRITQNLATDFQRRRPNEASIESLDEGRWLVHRAARETQSDAEARLEGLESIEQLLRALRCLPESYQTVVVLRYLEGLSNQELARLLGEPEGTIRNRLFRALGKLRQLMVGEKTRNP